MSGVLFNRINNAHSFDPSTSIPALTDKTIIVTGGNAGLGLQSIIELSQHSPGKIYMTARSKSKYDTAMTQIHAANPNARIDFLELDLSSFASIKKAADKFLSENNRLDILILNAGIMGQPPSLTKDGYETHFGTNHMGHALLTKLLMPTLTSTVDLTDDARVIVLSSTAHMMAPRKGFNPGLVTTDMSCWSEMPRYGQSKLANILFARELAKRYPRIIVAAIHPGRVQTGIVDVMLASKSFMAYFQRAYDYVIGTLTVEEGAWCQLWAATAPKELVGTGKYFVPVGVEDAADKRSRDEKLMKELWEWTEAEFVKHGY